MGLLLGTSLAQGREEVNLGGTGWRLWLDRQAQWKEDELYLPPSTVEGTRLQIPALDLAKVPVNAPSCGWENLFAQSRTSDYAQQVYSDSNTCLEVNVPGTVEEYFWDAVSGKDKGRGTSGDYVGVSWWGRSFTVPAEAKGKRIKLFFTEGARLRSEVYVNSKLVGYTLQGQLPFEVDVTEAVHYGADNALAVRITDPGGNFSWGDYHPYKWGKYNVPLAHGFGGILGAVRLVTVDPVYVSDVYVKNKPAITDVDIAIEYTSEAAVPVSGNAELEIVEAFQKGVTVAAPQTVFRQALGDFKIEPGMTRTFTASASVPQARVWGIREGNLYHAVVILKDAQGRVLDTKRQRFGFRWFGVEGYGTDGVCFTLNGTKQLFLSSISWGFWPVNGIYPTPELARKHIESALALGQNMLNFHRCVGNTQVLNLADEMGILYYEETGGYSCGYGPAVRNKYAHPEQYEFPIAFAREKLLHMVKRDRSHPSLVIYNMVNEPGITPDSTVSRDMEEAHRLDPTRFISFGSGFMGHGGKAPVKLHMLPYDPAQRNDGFCDMHNAGNTQGVYLDEFYLSPRQFRRNDGNYRELFIWGEEGAIASPPQLESIHAVLNGGGRRGWDGSDYTEWYQAYTNYIQDKGLTKYYPSIPKLITSLGDIMYYEHGRLVENVRIADTAALYVLNGYEDMKLDNFSGSVDCYRNLKGNAELIRQYMRPLMVSVKARDKIGHVSDTNLIDLFVLNEHALATGDYKVTVTVQRPDGQSKALYSGTAHVSGGNKFSDLVAEAVTVPLDGGKGYYQISARLEDATGKLLADGHEEMLAVDWKSDRIGGKGAIVYGSSDLKKFLTTVKKADVATYDDTLGRLDYVVIGSHGGGSLFQAVPFYCFQAKDGVTEGLNLDYFRGIKFDQCIDRRISRLGIDFDHKANLIPGYDILGASEWSLRWEGYLVPEHSGITEFEFSFDDGARLWIDGELVVDRWNKGPGKICQFSRDLQAGRKCAMKLEFFQGGGSMMVSLKWKLPATEKAVDLQRLLQRVSKDGTVLFVLGDADTWAAELKKLGAFPNYQIYRHSKSWVGGNYFVRTHPFFEDLPVNVGMNWEYQRLVMYDGPKHYGFYNMKGEEPVVSSVGSSAHLVATSVGILPYGKGKIVFSALNLMPALMTTRKADEVPRKILCNYLKWAGDPGGHD